MRGRGATAVQSPSVVGCIARKDSREALDDLGLVLLDFFVCLRGLSFPGAYTIVVSDLRSALRRGDAARPSEEVLEREMRGLKPGGYSPDVLTEFIRDMIAHLNGRYRVMVIDPNLLLARDEVPGPIPAG